jgi:hypothetical protein
MAFLPPYFPPNICGVREFLREKCARGGQTHGKARVWRPSLSATTGAF